MADDGIDGCVAEGRYEAECIAHQIGKPKRREIAIVVRVPASGATIATLIRRDHVIAGPRKLRHHLAPAIGKFRKAMQQQQTRAPTRLEASLEHMHAKAVDVFNEARVDRGGKGDVGEGGHRGHGCISSW